MYEVKAKKLEKSEKDFIVSIVLYFKLAPKFRNFERPSLDVE
jgi:hypothetical protein